MVLQSKGRALLPGGANAPSAGDGHLLPQLDAAQLQPLLQPADKPPLHGHTRALRPSQAGFTPVPLHAWLSPFKAAAFGAVPEGGLPDYEQQRSQARPGAAADSSSGGSQVTRVGSMAGQMSGLTGSPGSWADRAGQPPSAERQERQPSGGLLPELDALLEADRCPELPGPGAPGLAHGLLLPPALALQHPLSGSLGMFPFNVFVPGAVKDFSCRHVACLCCLCCARCYMHAAQCDLRRESGGPRDECKMRQCKPLRALNPFTGLAGPAGVMDSWDMDEEADLALFSDPGQPVARKGLKSLPPRFQASPQLGMSREGSTSLPAQFDRSTVVPRTESASHLPAPGVHCPGTGSCMHFTQLLAYACSCRCQAGPHMLTKTANVTA